MKESFEDPFKETRAVRRRRNARSGVPVGRPRKLTRDSIVEAAAALIEQQGESALTLRSLSASLGVQAATLYTYFDNLDEVAEAVMRNVLSAIPKLDGASATPLREQLIEHFAAVRAAHLQHPRLASGPIGSVAWQANLRHMDNALAVLMGTGISLEDALMAYSGLYGVTVSNASSVRESASEDVVATQHKIISSMRSDLPHVLQVVALLQTKAPAENAFRWMIGVLIDRLLPPAKAARPSRRK